VTFPGGNGSEPAIGIAYSGSTPRFLAEHGEAIDYVEVPFELLRHDSSVSEVRAVKPIVLHCASLSVAGSVPPTEQTIEAVSGWIERTQTEWLGEHLSFITASREAAGPIADEYAPGEPYNIGYTVCPPMNGATVDRVLSSIALAEERFPVPMILENPPVYFPVPGSTMTQVEFVSEICARSPVGLLLDLAHFYITSQTMGFDPCGVLESYPLERVVEVHLSGVETEGGGHWDNHAKRAPDIEFEMLGIALARSDARAVTLEYNWSSRFPASVLLEEIDRTRAAVPA
jgi:uncharacterized protein (UPF0276 family)